MPAYYNENEPYAAQWLRNLIAAGHIPAGDVDDRSICDVRPADLSGYQQCHFFAGLGGWAYACRLAGWPDDRAIWTGSCPCQPFSVAGKGEGAADKRHLWPEFHRLIAACSPPVVMGEQVAAAVGKHWLDGVCADMEGIGYACGAVVVPACAAGAPHRRNRLWFVADRDCERRDGIGLCDQQRQANFETAGCGEGDVAIGDGRRGSAWSGAEWFIGADGKARRVEPGIRLLAHGVPARVGKLRALGNAIVPQVAAELMAAWMDVRP